LRDLLAKSNLSELSQNPLCIIDTAGALMHEAIEDKE
jgi:hypothetical protein